MDKNKPAESGDSGKRNKKGQFVKGQKMDNEFDISNNKQIKRGNPAFHKGMIS